MTEQDFWNYFKKSCERRRSEGDGVISEEEIGIIGELLFKKEVSLKAKEVIIMTLAHQPSETALIILTKYNLRPEPGLKLFAEFALEECVWWNE